MIKIIIFFLLYVPLESIAADDEEVKVSIAQYRGGRDAAISYTFDDGLLEQYTLVFPELEKRNIKATFAVNGGWMGCISAKKVCMSWEQARKMAQAGHEITNHGWMHKNLTKLVGEERRFEIQHNDTVIFEQTGIFPRTYFYPGNRKNEEAIACASVDRVGTRIRQIDIGSRRNARWLTQWTDSLIANRLWGVGMTHGIVTGYDAFPDPQVFWNHLDEVNCRRDRLWVTTFREVAAYMAERENLVLDIKRTSGKITVTFHFTMDKELFDMPLTLLLEDLPDQCAVTVLQDGRNLPVNLCRRGMVVDFSPWGGPVEISYASSITKIR